jgi:hypothetical protein
MIRMWLLNRILSTTGKVFIKNRDLPICVNCVHFIEPKRQDDDYELYGRCKMFGQMNLITGDIHYGLAISCRSDNEKCGYLGTAHKERTSV